jgi:lipopolysaccharide transport system ATP-binding protein
MIEALARPRRRLPFGACDEVSRSSGASAAFWALQDVSFEIERGAMVGVIGRNGAGKSTLLKILSRITEPTRGFADIQGRVASLLEVGTGFHPELTGRENIFLNGAILGMKRREIERKFDEIVAFAEVETFIDTPVKRYSSGMYLRLAFAVAANLEPEILLVDEVLAVGDAVFQRKCLGKMGEVAKQGRTVFLVSHNMGAISHLCERALWLDAGRLRVIGEADEIVSQYLGFGVQEHGEITFGDDGDQAPGNMNARLLGVRIRDCGGNVTSVLDIRRPFTVEIEYRILRHVSNLRVGFRLVTQDAVIILSSNDGDSSEGCMERSEGLYVNQCTIPGEFLNQGQYFISVGSDIPMMQVNFSVDRVLTFHIEPTGGVGGHIPDRRQGILRIRLPWDTQRIG